MKLIFLALLFTFSFISSIQCAKAPDGFKTWDDPDKSLRDPKNAEMKRQLDAMLQKYLIETAKKPNLSLKSIRSLAVSTQFVRDKTNPNKLVSGQRIQYDVILQDPRGQKTEGLILFVSYALGSPPPGDLESFESYAYPGK